MTDHAIAVLRCTTCEKAVAVYPADLIFLLKIDWPHCCGGAMTFHRAREGEPDVIVQADG